MTSETLMTADDADTTQSSADSTLLGSQDESQATQEQAEEAPIQSEEQDAPSAEESADDAKDPNRGAPETYEFKAPEDQEFDPDVLKAYGEVARELDLSQEAAQKVLDKVAPALAEQQTKYVQEVAKQWRDASVSDKEFGGEKLNENLAVAKKALDTFGTPELRALLDQSGLGSHPELIRAFYRAGKSISEDTFVAGGNTKGDKQAPTDFAGYAAALYSNPTN